MTMKCLPLADVCEINPRLPREHGLADETPVSFVPMAAVDELSGAILDRQSRKFGEVRKGYTCFQNNDVLFAKITPCMENGKAAIASDLLGGVGFGSTEFHVLRANEALVAPEWLFYFMRREQFRREAKRNFTGTAGQQRVPASFLSNVQIPVPPLDEQRRIVDLLSRAGGIIRLRREVQKKASEIIPALFLDMFGDPTTNPKRWPQQRLGELVAFLSGGTPSKQREEFWTGDLPWISPKDMKSAAIVDATDYLNHAVLTETNLKLVPAESVLIVVRGMILIHTVPVALARVPLTINQDMKALVPKSGLDPTYLNWALRVSQDNLLHMVSTAAHGTRKLDTPRLEAMTIPLPAPNSQRTFRQLVAYVESIQTQQLTASRKAEAAFDALLTVAFARRPKEVAARQRGKEVAA